MFSSWSSPFIPATLLFRRNPGCDSRDHFFGVRRSPPLCLLSSVLARCSPPHWGSDSLRSTPEKKKRTKAAGTAVLQSAAGCFSGERRGRILRPVPSLTEEPMDEESLDQRLSRISTLWTLVRRAHAGPA